MKSIWKYPLPVTDVVSIRMPVGAVVLTVQLRWTQVCLWAMVDTDAPTMETRRFRVFGTDHPVEGVEADGYIGTVQQMDGAMVWHVFEVRGGES